MSESRTDMPASMGPASLGPSPIEDDARQLAAKLVNALYRLVKACQLHAETNQAVAQVTDYVVTAVAQFVNKADVAAAAILFSPHAVFVNRQMLKASRETYQLAIWLGTLSSLWGHRVPPDARDHRDEINDFGRSSRIIWREGKKSSRFESGVEGLKLRPSSAGRLRTHVSTHSCRGTYASAVDDPSIVIWGSEEGNTSQTGHQARRQKARLADGLGRPTSEPSPLVALRRPRAFDTDRAPALSPARRGACDASQLTTNRRY